MPTDHRLFMAIAVEEAKSGAAAGEQPFGAVIARDGKLICRTHSLKVSTCDTTAHSEILAVKAATQMLRQRTLVDCVFYSTCEPCPMCLGAVLNSGINTLVIGVRKHQVNHLSTKAFNFKDFTPEGFAQMVGWNLKVIDGVLADECLALYVHSTVELTR